MRVLVIGNSHVAAWREAWTGMGRGQPDVEIDFFAVPEKIHARYRLLASGEFRPRRVVTAEERARVTAMNGRVSCHLAGYDHAVWAGFGWRPEHAAEMAASGDPYPLAGERAALATGFVTAAFAEAAAAVVGAWPVVADGSRPILFGRPVCAATCHQSTHPSYAPWRAAAPFPQATQACLAAYRTALATAAAARGIRLLLPPDDLSDGTGLTDPRYLAAGGGIVDPAAPQVRGDHMHMNADYGRRCLLFALQAVRDGVA